jgi:hypothetical protein
MGCVRRHPGLRHGILGTPLLRLNIARVGQRLLRVHSRHVRDVVLRHVSSLRHARLLWRHVRGRRLFRRVDLTLVDAILIARCGLGGIQAGLSQGDIISRMTGARRACDLVHTWIRFLPSALVTSGCSFGVVKV